MTQAKYIAHKSKGKINISTHTENNFEKLQFIHGDT